VFARQVLRSFADAGNGAHAKEQEGRDQAESPEVAEPAPVQGAGKSAAVSVAHGSDDAPGPAVGADNGQAARELGGATHAPRDAVDVAKPAPEVPRASVASGAVPGLPSWIERLASAQRLGASSKGEALHFDLEPNGLGRIEVRLSVGRDGVRTQIFTEHEHTRTLLANQQSQLAAAFERNELRLESFLVDLGLGGEAGRDARHEPTDVNAFDQTGLVSSSTADDVVAEALPVAGLVSVRA
jgi:flagellar hook-length control protein FliK